MKQTVFMIFGMAKEFISGLFMATISFYVLPLSIDLIGIFPTFFWSLIGIFFTFFIKKIATNQFFYFQWILFGCLLGSFMNPAPFHSYFTNGIYLSVLGGAFLLNQVEGLSIQRKFVSHEKEKGILYILGLILGILLK